MVVTALLGELPLTIWLLAKGVDVTRWWGWAEPRRAAPAAPSAAAPAS